MTHNSITAYNLPERVATYDADMALMHPNRSKMVEIALQVLPFNSQAPFVALDLGVGTGFFTQAVLNHFPNSRIIALDGAEAMVELARTRLGSLADRVDFIIGDFRRLGQMISTQRGQLVFSSYALHHLNREEKLAVIRQACCFIESGGWFLNADLVIAPDEETEKRIQEVRVAAIVQRAAGQDKRFLDAGSTRRFLDDLEARDQDQPLTLIEDLKILKESGLRNASVFWMEYREAVTGGSK
jgi:ubiquinone/menaquinone biosynthesis C-methylase UbiE